MKVVFIKTVRNVAKAGQVKEVADGYARNYLIPRNLAVVATEAAIKQARERAAAQARRDEEAKAAAESQAAALEDIELVFTAKAGESGRLYGSITNADIAERLSEQLGEDVDRRKINLEEPIKELGTTKVHVNPHPGVSFTIKVTVEAVDSE